MKDAHLERAGKVAMQHLAYTAFRAAELQHKRN